MMSVLFMLWGCGNAAPKITAINGNPTRSDLYIDGEAWESEWVSQWGGNDGGYERYISIDLFEGVNDIQIDFKDADGDTVEIVWMEAPGRVEIDAATGAGTITLDYDPNEDWDRSYDDFGTIGIVDEHGAARSYHIYTGPNVIPDYDTGDTGW